MTVLECVHNLLFRRNEEITVFKGAIFKNWTSAEFTIPTNSISPESLLTVFC